MVMTINHSANHNQPKLTMKWRKYKPSVDIICSCFGPPT